MKKIFKILNFLILFFCIFSVNALENTDIYSNEALVVNMKNDNVLFSKNTNNESVPIASLTKLMTYVVSVENVQDIENTKIVVPNGIKQSIINKGGSNAGLEDGYEYSMIDLLYGLMLPSGCDAADVLAYYISNNNYELFVEMMNEKAKELGMNNTTFYNATGLEENGNNSVSTEEDLYKLAKHIYNLPYFKEIIKTEYYTLEGYKNNNIDTSTVRNTNYMIGDYNGEEYYYQYSQGGKTGNLSVAGRCLVSYAIKGDMQIVAITLGVANQHSNYHLNDHKKLFEYAFNEYSENINIEIGSLYKSVGIGKQIKINATTSSDTQITWKSSDNSIATVNKYGVVTGLKMGQVKITATTKTGNQDFAYVSVGFYNGVDVKYSSGPSDENGILGYGKIDWSIFKNNGIDFAIIRAGYAAQGYPDSDPYFTENIKGANNNNINIMISFDGYAKTSEKAIVEAQYLVDYLKNNIPEYLDSINLPIVYNMYNINSSDGEVLYNVAQSFVNVMRENGYDVIVELGRTKLSYIDLSLFEQENIGLYVIWRPTVPDFSTKMNVMIGEKEYLSSLWSYRTDAYFGNNGVNKRISMSVMYMDELSMNTNHNSFDKNLYPDKPKLKVTGNYVYNGNDIKANVKGFDNNTMIISNNIQKNAGTYTISVMPKEMWSDGSKDVIKVKFTINKATLDVDFPDTLEGTHGDKLSSIILPYGFEWENEEQVLDINKSNEFTMIYKPNNTKNYNKIKKTIYINILNKYYETYSNDEKYIIGVNDEYVINIDVENSLLCSEVYIDSTLLDIDDYIYNENTLKLAKEYLDALSIGNHTLKIVFSDGGISQTTISIDKIIEEQEIEKPSHFINVIAVFLIIILFIFIKKAYFKRS